MSIARKVDARAIHEIAMTWRLGEATERVTFGGEVTHMGRNSLIGWMLAVCFIPLIPTVSAAQTAAVKSLMAVLRADTEARAPKVLKVSADTAAVIKSLMVTLRKETAALGAPLH